MLRYYINSYIEVDLGYDLKQLEKPIVNKQVVSELPTQEKIK
jgi:hypothetical protein